MKTKLTILLIFFFYNILILKVHALENKILFKVNNEIISTIDLFDEAKYLKLINPSMQKLEENKIFEISKNSLIKEKIKKIELIKYYPNLDVDSKTLNQMIKVFTKRLGFNNQDELNNFFTKNNLEKRNIYEKIKIENMWNSLIVNKFLKDVKINEKQLEREINDKKIQYEYQLSEIVFESSNTEKLDKKYETIVNEISTNGFSNAAIIFSIAETAKNGGDLGWVSESFLNIKIKEQIKKTEVGSITSPILIPGGFLILKIVNKKQIEKEIDFKKIKEKIIREKTNEQLNQFSIIYFNKIKKNIKINEL